MDKVPLVCRLMEEATSRTTLSTCFHNIVQNRFEIEHVQIGALRQKNEWIPWF